MSPRPPPMDRLLKAAARRLAQRRAVRGATRGLWVGLALSAGALRARWLGWLSPWQAAILAAAIPTLAAGLGAGVGWMRGGLSERELALLVDRCLGTEEAVVTAMHQLQAGSVSPGLGAVVDTLGARAGEVAADLPLRPPPATRWAPPTWAAIVALALLSPPLLAPWLRAATGSSEPSAAAAEGERLAERMAELEEREEGSQLPEELQRDVADLASDLQGETLTPEEAVERLESLEQQLQQFQEELSGSDNVLEELEEAARELDAEATEGLSEALSQGDLEQAAQEAADLSEALSQATPEEQREAAEALQQAGEALQRSSEPGMQQAGEAMEQLGQQMQQQAQSGAEGQQGDPAQAGSQQGEPQAGEGTGSVDTEALRQALQQQRDLAERLQRDQERLAQAQQMQGAIEGAQERMGEEGQGAGGGDGEGEEEGQGQQVGVGQGQGAGQGAGDGHTWEDEGEFDASNEFQDGASAEAPEASKSAEAEHIDDFEKFYAPLRVDDAQALLATAEGELDESGRIDTLVTRLTDSDETAERPTLELPAEYRDAATEAIEAERIPPAYRDAVKGYFE